MHTRYTRPSNCVTRFSELAASSSSLPFSIERLHLSSANPTQICYWIWHHFYLWYFTLAHTHLDITGSFFIELFTLMYLWVTLGEYVIGMAPLLILDFFIFYWFPSTITLGSPSPCLCQINRSFWPDRQSCIFHCWPFVWGQVIGLIKNNPYPGRYVRIMGRFLPTSVKIGW